MAARFANHLQHSQCLCGPSASRLGNHRQKRHSTALALVLSVEVRALVMSVIRRSCEITCGTLVQNVLPSGASNSEVQGNRLCVPSRWKIDVGRSSQGSVFVSWTRWQEKICFFLLWLQTCCGSVPEKNIADLMVSCGPLAARRTAAWMAQLGVKDAVA